MKKKENEKMQTLTQQQLKNWRLAFPFLAFVSDEMIEHFAKQIEMRANAQVFEQKTKQMMAQRIKERFFHVIRVGTVFMEDGKKKTVSRVTDIIFDSVCDGKVEVRNLGLLRSKTFQENFSLVSI
jgi:hypothetical protein